MSNVKGERHRIYITVLHQYNENLSDVFNKEDSPQQQMDQISLGYHFYRLQSPKKHRSDSTSIITPDKVLKCMIALKIQYTLKFSQP